MLTFKRGAPQRSKRLPNNNKTDKFKRSGRPFILDQINIEAIIILLKSTFSVTYALVIQMSANVIQDKYLQHELTL